MIDPATAKIIAQLTAKAITDEQAGKRLLFIILAPTIGTLLMIAFILYLIIAYDCIYSISNHKSINRF